MWKIEKLLFWLAQLFLRRVKDLGSKPQPPWKSGAFSAA